jgi:phosphatidylinositol alpha-1,6-mannosyltransferase
MSETQRKTVLLITRNFPPMIGGMEKLNQRMLEGLSLTHRTILIGPNGCRDFAPAGTRVYEAPVANFFVFLIYAKCMAVYLALTQKPDVCLAGSGLTAPYAWLAARLSGASAVVYVHGLDLIADSRIYRLLWLPFIRRCDVIIANSGNTKRLAESVGVPADRISVVHPGTDIPVLNPEKAAEFRIKFGFGDCPLLLSVGRITERKGLLPFLQMAWPSVLARHPDAKLVVIGGEPQQALRKDRRSALADMRAYLSKSGLEESVRFLGRVDDATLTAAYQAANVHVFPVLDSTDDVEGFGMVAIEAAANGLPTVAFDAGGVADAVDQGHGGQLLTPGDYHGFSIAVLSIMNQPPSIQQQDVIRAKFGWIRFGRDLDRAIFPL